MWRDEIDALDVAAYASIAATPTPTFDRALGALSRAADLSKLWIGIATVLAVAGGSSGRRAAANGLASIAMTSAVLNLGLKPLGARRRPNPGEHRVPLERQVAMPGSTSFPSGHAASAFSFAEGVSRSLPKTGAALHWVAALVAYSRVHTGVHYPTDVVVGSLLGSTLSPAATRFAGRWASRLGLTEIR
ncbi:MAG: phosphatase PAP2 family protein [Acidimicrobiales bacterium]